MSRLRVTGPQAHNIIWYFDCQSITVQWYATNHKIPAVDITGCLCQTTDKLLKIHLDKSAQHKNFRSFRWTHTRQVHGPRMAKTNNGYILGNFRQTHIKSGPQKWSQTKKKQNKRSHKLVKLPAKMANRSMQWHHKLECNLAEFHCTTDNAENFLSHYERWPPPEHYIWCKKWEGCQWRVIHLHIHSAGISGVVDSDILCGSARTE